MKNYISILLLLMFVTLSSCEKNKDQNIYCVLKMKAVLPDEGTFTLLRPDNTLNGTYIRNLNTRLRYDVPSFSNGEATIQILKGVYLITFDGVVTLTDGTTKKVRFSGHNSPQNAVRLLEDNQELTLKLTVLDF